MDTKKTIFAGAVAVAVIGAFAIGFSLGTPAQTGPEQRAGSTRISRDEFTTGATLQDATVFYKKLTIGASENQASFQLKEGKLAYVSLEYARTTGTATTSPFRLQAGTSTAATITNTLAAPTQTQFTLLDFAIASSSAATTTNSLHGAGSNWGVVTVADNGWVNLVLIQGDNAESRTPDPSCNGGLCETATSTNRGISSIEAIFKVIVPK